METPIGQSKTNQNKNTSATSLSLIPNNSCGHEGQVPNASSNMTNATIPKPISPSV